MAAVEEVDKMKNNKSIKYTSIILLSLSIISIILSFFIYLYILPVCIIGVIVGYILKNKSILNIISAIIFTLCIVLSVILFIFFKENPYNDFIGTWNCKYYNNEKFSIKLEINKENKFVWSKDDNNYIKGNYELEILDKKDSNKNVKYYKLTLNSEKFIENNKEQNKEYNKNYDLAINKEEKKIIMTNKEKMTFSCIKISEKNPIVE